MGYFDGMNDFEAKVRYHCLIMGCHPDLFPNNKEMEDLAKIIISEYGSRGIDAIELKNPIPRDPWFE